MVTTVNDRELRGSDFSVGISAQAVKDVIDNNPVFIPVRRTEGKTSKVVNYVEDPSVNGNFQALEQIQDSEDLTAELSTVFSKQTVEWLIQAIHADEVEATVTNTDIAATATGFTSVSDEFTNLQVGDGIWVSGFVDTTINVFYIIATKPDNGEITTTVAPAAAEVAGASVMITTNRSLNEDAPTYNAIQTRAVDNSKGGDNINYHTIYNAIINSFSMEIGETGIVTATTSFVAEAEVGNSDAIAGQTYSAALTDRAVSSRKNAEAAIKAFYVDNAEATCIVKSMSIEINNQYQKDSAAGCIPFYTRGQFQCGGSIVVRSKISDPFDWRDKSWNGTRVSIGVRISHNATDETYIVMRRNVVTEVTIPDGNNVAANTEASFQSEENFATTTTIETYRNWQ